MSSIADKLSLLLDPTPSADPEDENEDTSARLVDKAELIQDEAANGNEVANKSKLRNPISAICFEEKYAGKVVSRIDNLDDFSDNDEDISEVDPPFDDSISDLEDDIDHESSINQDEEEDDASMVDEKMVEGSDEDEEILSDEADDVQMFTDAKPAEENISKKGDTKFQISMGEKVLETRIKLQKTLSLANKLPRSNTHRMFLQADQSISDLVTATSESLTNLCSTLLSLQSTLHNKIDDGSVIDEQIHQENEDIKELDDQISKRSLKTKARRNKTLNYWYDKTKLLSNKVDKSFSSFERPVVDQIEQILADRDRLIKRTRTKRSEYSVLGSNADEADTKQHDSHLSNLDTELFDDDDFYQQLLQQFIQQKAMTPTSDSNNLNRQWLKVQRMHSKIKKTVDTKASKGRKVRYHVHPKLVSFMSSHDKSTWSHDSRNQLVRSVFGKVDVR